jgi:hypothetical protein
MYLDFFDLVPKSPINAGLDCIKTLEPNISCLGTEGTDLGFTFLRQNKNGL